MALHWFESFEGKGNVDGTSPPVGWVVPPPSWPFTGSARTGVGRYGSTGVQATFYGDTIKLANFPASVTSTWPVPPTSGDWSDTLADGSHIAITGAWIEITSVGLGTWEWNTPLIGIYAGLANDAHYLGRLVVHTNGQMSYQHWVGSNGNYKWVTYARSVKAKLNARFSPHFVELKIVMAASGSVEARVDGETVLSITGVETRAANRVLSGGTWYTQMLNRWSAFIMHTPPFAGQMGYTCDDIYLADGRPGANGGNNDFFGDYRIFRLYPTADYIQQFVPTPTGQSWSCVDEDVNDPADYVQTANKNKIDLYQFSDPPSVGVVHAAVQHIFTTRDTADKTIEGLVEYPNPSGRIQIPLTVQEGALYPVIYETAPGSATGWTSASLAAAKFGYKSVDS